MQSPQNLNESQKSATDFSGTQSTDNRFGLQNSQQSNQSSTANKNSAESSDSMLATAGQTIKSTLSDAGQQISKGYDMASEQAKKASTQLESFVRNKPIIAVAAAIGIGWVAGRLLTPRRDV